MYQTAVKKLSRLIVTKSRFFLPRKRQIAIERRHRGREQFGKLERADVTVVSHGKSGRTWLRVMMSRFYQQKHGLPEDASLVFDNFHRRDPGIPKIFFTHDNYVRDYTGSSDVLSDYGGRKVVLLVRNPADVVVSQFFQWKFRMKRGKKDLLGYPDHGADVELYDFLVKPEWGLPRTIGFMNLWAEALPRMDDLHVIRYEDLRADPAGELSKLLEFLGTPGTPEEIADAVDYGSVDKMRQREREAGESLIRGGRLRPRDKDNPSSYKVRRAKVGGYMDYLDDEQAEVVNAMIDTQLSPVFGYTGGTASPPSAAESASA